MEVRLSMVAEVGNHHTGMDPKSEEIRTVNSVLLMSVMHRDSANYPHLSVVA